MAIAFSFAFGPVAAAAQTTATDPWVEDSIRSTHLSDVRRLRIVLPDGYGQRVNAQQRYAVVILLGDDDDDVLRAIAYTVQQQASGAAMALPPLIVVGVRGNTGLFHDAYPPTTGEMAKAREGAGAVDAHTAFLTLELVPWIASHYRTHPFTVLAGHSAWGHAAVYAYAHAPETITAAIAVSPAIWWLSDAANDDASIRDYAARVAKRTGPGLLFVGVGGFDPGPIVKGVDRLAAAMPKSSSFEYRRYPSDNHNSTVPLVHIDGLRAVFAPVSLAGTPIWSVVGFSRVDSAALAHAYADTKRRYADGARTLGFPERLPMDFFEFMSNVPPGPGRRNESLPIAKTICADFVAAYPMMPIAYRCLADLLFKQGDFAGARREYDAALTVARRDAWPNVACGLEQILKRVDSAAAVTKRP